jgi:tetratricopeptide (TPR) repeat protein
VSTILEGSVRKSGDRLRVTAQLINAADGYHLWSQRYDRAAGDVFAIQDEIATAIATALRLRLGGTLVERRSHQPILRAYEAFLSGRHFMFMSTSESFARAKDAFEQAIELDPEYAESYCELANWHFVQWALGRCSAEDTMPMARMHAQKAVQLNPVESRAHAVLGAIAALYERDWQKAGEEVHIALASSQVPPEVRLRCAVTYFVPLGLSREALEQLERAVEQDPLNVLFRGILALFLAADSPDRGAIEAQKAIDIDERHFLPWYAMSVNQLRRGDLPQARELADRSTAKAPPWIPLPTGLSAGILRRMGKHPDADLLLSRLQSPSGMFIYHMVCSDIDAAADSLAKAIAERDLQPLMWFGAADFLRPLRASQRWPALARTMNLPAEMAG